MDNIRGLEILPLEILQMVIQLTVPVDQYLSVHYQPRNDSCTHDATNLMLVSKYINTATVAIVYSRNTFYFDKDPENDLPLFLQNLRESTFHMLRQVKVRFLGADIRHGLDHLLKCRSLKRLEIATPFRSLTVVRTLSTLGVKAS
jgi:hypothetical protein